MEKSIVTKISLFLTLFCLLTLSHAATPLKPLEKWRDLMKTPSNKLLISQEHANNFEEYAWIELAIMAKQKEQKKQTHYTKLTNNLADWRERYPSHPANQLFPSNDVLAEISQIMPPQHIAILLPESGKYADIGKAVRAGYLSAYYANLENNKQILRFYDTSQPNQLATLYQKAIADGADLIIGPLLKENVNTLSHSLDFKVPTIALNYLDTPQTIPNFFQFGLLPEDEIKQLAEYASSQGHRKALVITTATPFEKRLNSTLSSAWQKRGGSIETTFIYNPTNTLANLKFLLQHTKSDAIFLLTSPKDAERLLPFLQQQTPLAIYGTSSLHSKGVTLCDLPLNFASHTNNTSNRFYALGQDTYLLSQTLLQFKSLPNFPIYGMSGAMTLSPTQAIHRRLPCKTIS